jgi:hypothetical protein
MKGHFNYENETLNGKLTAKTKSEQQGENVVTFEYKDMIVTEDKMIGDAVVNGDVNGQKMELVYSFNINDDNGTMDIKATSNGEDMGSFKMDMQTTDASDITVPTGTTYKMTDEEEMKKYTESCDVEGWQENVKKALGEELYNDVFGAQQVEAADGEAVAAEEAEPEAKTEKKTEKKAEKKSA